MKRTHLLILLALTLCSQLGFGQFGPQQEITESTAGASDVHTADLDGDGDMDVLSASAWSNKIAWYQNDGNGNFGIQQIISNNTDEASSVYAADMDGDGDMDVLSASEADDKIAWYQNDGNGNFSSQQVITNIAYSAKDVYVSDLDGDGDMDVLSASSNIIVWYQNDGSGNFGSQQVITIIAYSANSVYASDLDGDGDMDVLSGSEMDTKIAWYQNDGNGNFGMEQIISTNANYVQSVYTSDLDGDGDMDVLSDSGDTIAWYQNDGNGNFSTPQVSLGTFHGNSVYTSDLDGDGDMDVLSASSKIVWYQNDGDGNFDTLQIISNNADGACSIYASDIDGDGDMDVLSASKSDAKIAWYQNDGNGNFGSQRIISINALRAISIYSCDIDSDGDIDVLSASENDDKIAWYQNDGNGGFGTQQIISTNAVNAKSVHSCDIDSDGDMDVLSASYDDDKIAWYQNDGNGNFGVEQIISTNADGATFVYASDIDGDGDMDVLSGSSYRIAWYQNDGNGNFGPQQIVTTEVNGLQSVHTSDIDGDGNMDVLSAADDKIAWYQNDGNGNFGIQQIISNNADEASSVYAADMDGDGDMDVLSASQANDKIAWYQNNGNGNFGEGQAIYPYVYTTNFEISIYASDIDGDGDMDVLLVSLFNNLIVWYENYYNSPYKIKGNIFYDENQNGQKDSLEMGLSYLNIELNPNELGSFSNQYGEYWFATDTGDCIVSYNPINYWALTTDSAEYNILLTATEPIIDSLDFGFYPDTIITEISGTVTSSSTRCDSDIMLWINFANTGTTNPNIIVEFVIDASYSYITSSISPDSIIGQNLYWFFDSLEFFQEEMISLIVHSPDFNSMGNTINYTVNFYNASGDVLYLTETLTETITCSYDPNDKIVTPKGIGTQGYVSRYDTLEYTVRFQNTGNAEAINIKIRDQIDENINIQSMQILASSHNVQAYVEQNRWLVFNFENIMLPDSNVNELESHGFVKYRLVVDTNSLPNTPIYNTANIYFDNNPAVVTNIILNTVECYITPTAPSIEAIDTVLSVTTPYQVQWYLEDTVIFGATDTSYFPTEQGNYMVEVFDENGCSSFSGVFVLTNNEEITDKPNIKTYPNPTTGIVMVEAININRIEVIDINGKNIFTSQNTNKIDLSNQPKGIYFIRITSEKTVVVEKVVLE